MCRTPHPTGLRKSGTRLVDKGMGKSNSLRNLPHLSMWASRRFYPKALIKNTFDTNLCSLME